MSRAGLVIRRYMAEVESTGVGKLISEGAVRVPTQDGMPDLVPDLAEDVASVSDLVIADRDKERKRR